MLFCLLFKLYRVQILQRRLPRPGRSALRRQFAEPVHSRLRRRHSRGHHTAGRTLPTPHQPRCGRHSSQRRRRGRPGRTMHAAPDSTAAQVCTAHRSGGVNHRAAAPRADLLRSERLYRFNRRCSGVPDAALYPLRELDVTHCTAVTKPAVVALTTQLPDLVCHSFWEFYLK
jgi:hypothetical protein